MDEPRRRDGSYKVVPLEGPEASTRYYVAVREEDGEALPSLALQGEPRTGADQRRPGSRK